MLGLITCKNVKKSGINIMYMYKWQQDVMSMLIGWKHDEDNYHKLTWWIGDDFDGKSVESLEINYKVLKRMINVTWK